jgi:hypothetical protein
VNKKIMHYSIDLISEIVFGDPEINFAQNEEVSPKILNKNK